MPLIADFVDYEPARTWDQGKSSQCTAYSFFTLLAEHVQQETGKEVEFDFDKYFKEMEKNREGMLRVKYLCSKAMKDGYRTKTGELVKIASYRKFNAWRNWKFLCEHIQSPNAGPMLFAVNRYVGHDLSPKDTDIIEMPTEEQFKKKKKSGHMMILRGFDNQAKWLRWQNSWEGGEDLNVKWCPWEVFQKINKYCYYIKNVTISE